MPAPASAADEGLALGALMVRSPAAVGGGAAAAGSADAGSTDSRLAELELEGAAAESGDFAATGAAEQAATTAMTAESDTGTETTGGSCIGAVNLAVPGPEDKFVAERRDPTRSRATVARRPPPTDRR